MGKRVVLYSKPDCVYCEQTKDWLETYDISYEEVNFMDKSNIERVKGIKPAIESGQLRGLPIIDIEGHDLFDGFKEDLLEEYLIRNTVLVQGEQDDDYCADCEIDFTFFDDLDTTDELESYKNEEDLESYLELGAKVESLTPKEELLEFLPVDWVMDYIESHEYPLTELGAFTYTRTYSRWLDGRGRREFWHETVKRALEYNFSLAYSHLLKNGLKPSLEVMQEEAKELFKNVYHTKQFPSGRTLWIGNASEKVNKEFTSGNFNCSFLNIETWTDLGELFYLLLVGESKQTCADFKPCEPYQGVFC